MSLALQDDIIQAAFAEQDGIDELRTTSSGAIIATPTPQARRSASPDVDGVARNFTELGFGAAAKATGSSK